MKDSSDNSPSRVCVLTARGRGAIAVVSVAGLQATELVATHFVAANGRPLGEQPLGRVVYGHGSDAVGEDLVVCRRKADEVEIHCHGGMQSVARMLTVLVSAGTRQIAWKDWIAERSASQLEAEAQVALAAAPTLRTARILLDQCHGALRRELEEILALLDSNLCQAAGRIEHLLRRADVGVHLIRPWQVTVAGRPNAGKSTLVNALAGYRRAIEFDQPGTTRDVVSVTTAMAGWPIELSDTAGLHATVDEIELAGIALAREQLSQADLVLWLLDATSRAACSAEALVANQAAEIGVPWSPEKTLAVVNKCDLAEPAASLGENLVCVSATSGNGVPELIDLVAKRLVPQPPPVGAAVPFTARQVEILRAALNSACDARVSAAQDALGGLLAPIAGSD